MSIPDSYKRNSGFYDKNGRARGGHFTLKASMGVPKDYIVDKDIGNRNAVVNNIVELMNSGMTLEESCKHLAKKPEIINNFKYFAKDCLLQIFESWYKQIMIKKESEEKGER